MQNYRFNQGQTEVLEKFSKSDRNLFVTGPGGTGKSVVLSKIIEVAKQRKLHTAVLAPTAVAARLIDGQTWHSFFGVGILQGGLTASKNKSLSCEDRLQTFRDLDLLIIDEISFVREEELRLMSWILQLARGNSDRAFGGVRTLLFGDFFQLPPVPRPGELEPPHFAFQESRTYGERFHTWRKANFLKLSLTENLRSVDPEYTRFLSLIRDGMPLSHIELELLRDRQKAFIDLSGEADQHLWILLRNEDCEHVNLKRLRSLSGPVMKYSASFQGELEFFKHSPVPDELFLKVGARVMLRKNEYDFGALNGDVGTVRGLTAESVQVEFGDGRLVQVNRCMFDILNKDYEVAARVQQIPLSLAYAVTVHKAQGQTIRNPVVVDLTGAWAPGHAYVALSRVCHREQIFLRGEIPDDTLMKRERSVVDFYKGKYSPLKSTKNSDQMITNFRYSPARARRPKALIRRRSG